MQTKLSRICDAIIEAGWLAALVVAPLFFNTFSSRVFEPDKIHLVRSIALVMAAAWLVQLIDGAFARPASESADRVPRAFWRTPLLLPALLEEEGWQLDLAPFRYLSHFITPPSSPIRFTARFFLAPVPAGQEPRLLGGEASEGFWIDPAEGHRRFLAGEMQMAEPADCGLRYLAGFDDLDAVWDAHTDGRHKFHGITDRIEAAGFSIPRGKRSGQG